jgi:hypothetical protein
MINMYVPVVMISRNITYLDLFECGMWNLGTKFMDSKEVKTAFTKLCFPLMENILLPVT